MPIATTKTEFTIKGDVQRCGLLRRQKVVQLQHYILRKKWKKLNYERTSRLSTSSMGGFMSGRATTDAIFALNILMENYRERHKRT